MSYALIVEDKPGSPDFGKEVSYPVTIIDAPPMSIVATRSYTKDVNGLRTVTEVWANSLSRDLERIKGIPKEYKTDEKFKMMEEKLAETVEFRVLVATQPRLTGAPKKKPELMEIKIGGGTMNEQFNYAKSMLGKSIAVEGVFKEGQYIDVISITKGKGWQGVVKRWGVRILQDKSRKTKRGVATLGPWGPARILYTVPRAGQVGYHQRTEYNKRILRIGKEGNEVTPSGGFLRYGPVRNSYILLAGSIPGPAKRLIRLRYPARTLRRKSEEPVQITFLSTESKQGV
jgi:large subunit ribosomal protein L3